MEATSAHYVGYTPHVLMKIVEATRNPVMVLLLGKNLTSEERKSLLARTVYRSVSFKTIMRLICDGDLPALRELIDAGVVPLISELNWTSAAIKAARLGKTDVLKLFLDKGISIYPPADAHDEYTVFSVPSAAAFGGHLQTVKLLVDYKVADANACQHMVEVAAVYEHREVIKFLVNDCSARIPATALVSSIEHNCQNSEFLLELGAEVDESVLLMAASYNDIETLRAIFDRHAQPVGGSASVVEASKYDRWQVVEFLMSRGVPAEVSATTKAAKHGSNKSLTILLNHGVPVNEDAAWKAAKNGHVGTLEILFARGAPFPAGIITGVINDGLNSTGYHLDRCGDYDDKVAYEHHRQVLQFLISKDLPMDVSTTNAAILTGSADILKMLLDNRAPVCLSTIMKVGNRSTLGSIERYVRSTDYNHTPEKCIIERALSDWRNVCNIIAEYTCTPNDPL